MTATDLTSTSTFYEQDTGLSIESNSPYEYKEIMVETPATATGTDTVNVTLATYGITSAKTIKGFRHSTAGSVVVTEDPTTSVTTGVLTITMGATDTGKRVYIVGGY